jgi:hypothetical protein
LVRKSFATFGRCLDDTNDHQHDPEGAVMAPVINRLAYLPLAAAVLDPGLVADAAEMVRLTLAEKTYDA